MASMETDKRKVEAIRALLQDLSAGSTDQVPVCLRMALERGWNEELPSYIHHFEEKKRDEVHRHCKRHYDEFLASVEDLVGVSTDTEELLVEAEALAQGVDDTANFIREKAEDLAGLQAAQRHVAAAAQGVDECLGIVEAVERVETALASGRFYSALSALDDVQGLLHGAKGAATGETDFQPPARSLFPSQDRFAEPYPAASGVSFVQSLRNNAFSQRMDGWLKRLKKRIMKQGTVELTQWLLRIRELAPPVGHAASRRMAQHLLLSRGFGVEGAGAEGEEGGTARHVAFAAFESVPALRGLLRLAETLGFEKWGDLGWLPECVPEVFMPSEEQSEGGGPSRRLFDAGASLNLASKQVQMELLDSLEEQLHSVHIGLLIHAHFGELAQFRAFYTSNRLPQGELRAVHTTNLASLPFEAFLQELPKIMAGVVGFYAMESRLLQEADAPEGLPEKEEYTAAWQATQAELVQTIKRQLDSRVLAAAAGGAAPLSPPLLISLKEQLFTFSSTIADATLGTLDLDVLPLTAFMRGDLRASFDVAQKSWLRAEVHEALGDALWQPLHVADVYDFNRLVAPMDLHTVRNLLGSAGGDGGPTSYDEEPSPMSGTVLEDSTEGHGDDVAFAYRNDPLLRVVADMLALAVPRAAAGEGPRFPLTLPFSGGYCMVARALHRFTMHACAYNLGNRPKWTRSPGEEDEEHAIRPAELAEVGIQCQWLTRSVETALLDVLELLQGFLVSGNDRYTLSKACQLYIDSVHLALMPDRFTPVLSDIMVYMVGRSLAASPAAQTAMDDALAIVGDNSRTSYEGLAQKARDVIFETLRAELADLLGSLSSLGPRFWTPGVPSNQTHGWTADVITFLRVTFMTKLSFLPNDVRESLHYLACSHLHSEVLESLTGSQVQKVDLYGLCNLKNDVAALESFADECGVVGLKECFSEARDTLGLLTDARLESLVADEAALERKYPHVQKAKAAGVLRKLQNLSAVGLAQTGTANLPAVDKRKAIALARTLSHDG